MKVLQPFRDVQLFMEGEKYLLGADLIPTVESLRRVFKQTCTQRMERANGRNATALDKKVNTLLQDMYKDFEARWGDGNRLLIDSSGPRQQPRGYSKVHALAMACNPKTNDLPFVTAQDRDRIWAWVQEEVEKILIEWGPRALPGHKRRPTARWSKNIAAVTRCSKAGPDGRHRPGEGLESGVSPHAALPSCACSGISSWSRPAG